MGRRRKERTGRGAEEDYFSKGRTIRDFKK
jgi:hypothetical protein